MRVVHVVALISPGMEFGGPLRVATNEALGLQSRRHELALIGGWRGFKATPQTFLGLKVKAYRVWPSKAPFVVMAAPALWVRLPSVASDYELAHVHLGRDLITMVSASLLRIRRVPYIVQTHGMIEPSRRRVIVWFDRIVTRFVLRGAAIALTLTDSETALADALAGKSVAVKFANAVDVEADFYPHEGDPRVLFLARVHPRKRADQFARVASRIARIRPRVMFDIAGPDEGGAADLCKIIDESPEGRLRYLGAVAPRDVKNTMANASIYVLPAPAEPFGMTILEALSAGRPVVVHETAALAPFLVSNGAALTFDGSDDSLLSAITTLLDDPVTAAEMGRRGQEAVARQYGLEQSLDELENIYRRALHVES